VVAVFDLSDPSLLLRDDVVADPYEFYDVLRTEAPVWAVPGQDTFLVSDPDLIREAVARTGDFSSNLVALLHRGPNGTLQRLGLAPMGDPSHVLAIADPPDHSAQRRLLQPHLSIAAVGRYEPRMRQIIDGLLEPLLDAGGGDAVELLCDPFPAFALCLVSGLPEADVPSIVSMVSRTALLIDGVTDDAGMAEAAAGALDLITYGADQLDLALGRPPDDSTLLGVLAAAVSDGTLNRDQASNILTQLFTAGTETTTSLIARSIETLATHPALQQQLRDETGRIPAFLEEVLRHTGPFQFHYRWTPDGTDLGDTHIPAGSVVLLMWAAADRCANAEPSNEEPFDLDDDSKTHFAFGRGLHFCIGAHLARLEARLATEHVLARTTDIRLDRAHKPSMRPSLSIKRMTSLPILVSPTAT
jgi:cytochrome P450